MQRSRNAKHQYRTRNRSLASKGCQQKNGVTSSTKREACRRTSERSGQPMLKASEHPAHRPTRIKGLSQTGGLSGHQCSKLQKDAGGRACWEGLNRSKEEQSRQLQFRPIQTLKTFSPETIAVPRRLLFPIDAACAH